MKKLLLFIIIFGGIAAAQQKYLIYFTDKEAPGINALNKSSETYTEALNQLTEKSIERRKKVLGDDFVLYEDLRISPSYTAELNSRGINVIYELRWLNAVSAVLASESIDEIRNLSFVSKVEMVKQFKRRDLESSIAPFSNSLAKAVLNYGQSLTQLSVSNIPQVHKAGINGAGVIVGLLDTGFRWRTHEALQDALVLAERDFIFNDNITANEPEDTPSQDSHGTAIFSIIGGYQDSTLIGASYGASFLLAKTEDVRSETQIEEDYYAAALQWMENQGVDITSSSLGYNEFDSGNDYTYQDMNGQTTVVTRAAETAFRLGVVTITAAGNEGNSSWRYITAPADGFNTIAVGAVNSTGNAAGFSSIGPTADGRIKPDVSAMGVSVFGAGTSGFSDYSFNNGTSVAAPIAAGAAALLLSAHPHLTNVQVRDILLRTADNFDTPNNSIGYGIVNAFDAVTYPNLNKVDGVYSINKLFFDEDGVNPSTIKLYYSTNNKDFVEAVMTPGINNLFTYQLPVLPPDQRLNFYFTYTDSSGNIERQPSADTYGLNYGSLLINQEEERTVPESLVLEQNYPNPFNNKTTIRFFAKSNENAEMIIIDGAGQKVSTIFKGIANIGENTAVWNGYSDNGYQCASGVYYYILKLGGTEYGNKMILLK